MIPPGGPELGDRTVVKAPFRYQALSYDSETKHTVLWEQTDVDLTVEQRLVSDENSAC